MTAKEFLSQAFYLDKRIKGKLKQIERLRGLAEGAMVSFSDMPKIMGDHRRSKVEEYAVHIADLEKELASDIENMKKLQKDIKEAIARIGNIQLETILELRYLSYLQWPEIAAEMNYSADYVFQLHRRALRMIHLPC